MMVESGGFEERDTMIEGKENMLLQPRRLLPKDPFCDVRRLDSVIKTSIFNG